MADSAVDNMGLFYPAVQGVDTALDLGDHAGTDSVFFD